MIENYIRPQSIIYQQRERLPSPTARQINTVVVGAQYDLHRYTDEEERAQMDGVPFVPNASDDPAARQAVPYEGAVPGRTIDKSFVRLYGENLLAKLAEFDTSGTDIFQIESLETPNVIALAGGTAIAGASLDSKFAGRDTQPGDRVQITSGSETVQRVVLDVIRAMGVSSYGTNSTKSDSAPAADTNNPALAASASVANETASVGSIAVTDEGSWSGLLQGSRFAGKYGERYTITVTQAQAADTGNAEVRIRSASGGFDFDGVTVTGAAGTWTFASADPFGGATVTITAPSMPLGATFSFEIYGAYTPLVMGTDLVLSGAYSGEKDTTYLMTVVQGSEGGFTGAVVRVTDTAGSDIVQEYEIDDGTAVSLGTRGLNFEFDQTTAGIGTAQNGLRKGDVYYVHAVAAKRSGLKTVAVLDGPAADTTGWTDTNHDLAVTFLTAFSGEISPRRHTAPALAWEASDAETGILVRKDLRLHVPERSAGSQWVPFVDSGVRGRLYAHYRQFVPASLTESPASLASSDQIAGLLGKTDPANPVAQAAFWASSGAAGRIYALRLISDDSAGWDHALKILGNSRQHNIIAAATGDIAVHEKIRAHVRTLSSETKKRWRKTFAGIDSPEEIARLTATADGENILATITSSGGANIKVTAAAGGFLAAGVKAGDILRTKYTADSWGDFTHQEQYTVASVVSDTELTLVSGPELPVNIASKIEIWADDSAANVAGYMAGLARQFGSERFTLVWTDSPQRIEESGTRTLHNWETAAYIAGLRQLMPPQQGMTYAEVPAVSSAPTMYSKFTEDDLDFMAASGVFIVTQEHDGGSVFVRHQLTTETSKGSLYYEDNITTNFDNICYLTDDIIRGYIGHRNATSQTVQQLKVEIENMLSLQTQGSGQIGPALIGFENLVVEIDPNLRDRINVSADLIFPLPVNNVVVRYTAVASFAVAA